MATQVSTYLSVSTKERMERFVRATGTTRAHLIEQALLHHLRALEEIPTDAIVPARLVVTRDSAERVRRLIERPPEPNEHLRKLFEDR